MLGRLAFCSSSAELIEGLDVKASIWRRGVEARHAKTDKQFYSCRVPLLCGHAVTRLYLFADKKGTAPQASTPTSKPILHAIVPRIAVGNAEQTRAFYGRIGFACTHQDEGFMIVERDGVQLHLHPSNELPTGHGAFWIRVSNIEALYQEYLAVDVITSSKVKAQPWGFKQFHICDPFRTSLFSPKVSLKKRGVLNKPGKQKDFSRDLVKHLIALLTSIIAQKRRSDGAGSECRLAFDMPSAGYALRLVNGS